MSRLVKSILPLITTNYIPLDLYASYHPFTNQHEMLSVCTKFFVDKGDNSSK